ncbi:TPA_asm: M [Phyllostachys alphacytorhabdovirus 1]|nr:TPA_asm: M [Phyllostachys alphacytorhabdovirus 1]
MIDSYSSMASFRWYRITFPQSEWYHDIFHSTSIPSQSSIERDSREMFVTAIKSVLSDEIQLVELLSNLVRKDWVKFLFMLVESPISGPDTTRCALIFPNEVFIPTKSSLRPGKNIMALSNRMMKVHDSTYVVNINTVVGVSEIDEGDVHALMMIKASSFIGCLDSDPLGTKVTSGKDTPKSKAETSQGKMTGS